MDSELPPVMRVLEMRSVATGEVFCSATAFSGFIITALHCLLGDDGKLVDPSDIYFTTVDKNVSFKSEFRNFYYVTSASFDSEGNRNEVDNESFEDWALIIPSGEQNKDATSLATLDDQISGVMLYDGTDENAISIGYGSLQILSDQQIDFIKQQWARYLSEHRIYEDVDVKPKVVSTINPEGILFLSEIEKYGVPKSIFKDMHMKYSRCKLDGGEPYKCQVWGGDSGGPVFVQSKDDNKWLYYAVRSIGPSSIGAASGTPSREWTHNGGVTYASMFWDRVKDFFSKQSNSYSYWWYDIYYGDNFERK
jgi:V8-like Glu-specific endopeptidase